MSSKNFNQRGVLWYNAQKTFCTLLSGSQNKPSPAKSQSEAGVQQTGLRFLDQTLILQSVATYAPRDKMDHPVNGRCIHSYYVIKIPVLS